MVKIKKGEPMYAIEDMKVFELIADEEMIFNSWADLRQHVLKHGKEIRKKQ